MRITIEGAGFADAADIGDKFAPTLRWPWADLVDLRDATRQWQLEDINITTRAVLPAHRRITNTWTSPSSKAQQLLRRVPPLAEIPSS